MTHILHIAEEVGSLAWKAAVTYLLFLMNKRPKHVRITGYTHHNAEREGVIDGVFPMDRTVDIPQADVTIIVRNPK